MPVKKIKTFKAGDPIEIVAVDHTTEDGDGWKTEEEVMKFTPLNLHVRGYYVGEDDLAIKVAFSKCGDSFGTIFNIIKGTIVKIK